MKEVRAPRPERPQCCQRLLPAGEGPGSEPGQATSAADLMCPELEPERGSCAGAAGSPGPPGSGGQERVQLGPPQPEAETGPGLGPGVSRVPLLSSNVWLRVLRGPFCSYVCERDRERLSRPWFTLQWPQWCPGLPEQPGGLFPPLRIETGWKTGKGLPGSKTERKIQESGADRTVSLRKVRVSSEGRGRGKAPPERGEVGCLSKKGQRPQSSRKGLGILNLTPPCWAGSYR